MDVSQTLNTAWLVLMAIFVLGLNAGLIAIQAGFCEKKNSVSFFARALANFAICMVLYFLFGWGLQYARGNAFWGLGRDMFLLQVNPYNGWLPVEAVFFFRFTLLFTATNVLSGILAGRVKFLSFLVFAVFFAGFLYPTVGHWVARGGWLANVGFNDFAGATRIHGVAGWAGLAGLLLVHARHGKYVTRAKLAYLPGHHLLFASLGMLWVLSGWFALNAGQLGVVHAGRLAHIMTGTALAASGGLLSAMLVSYGLSRKADVSILIQGMLGALVASSAVVVHVSLVVNLIVGILAGLLTMLMILSFERFRIDDPVGALSIHLVNGIFGPIALGLFAQAHFFPGTTGDGLFYGGGNHLLVNQLIGVLVIGAFTFLTSLFVLWIIRLTLGLRQSITEELVGLDRVDHGNNAYPEWAERSVTQEHIRRE